MIITGKYPNLRLRRNRKSDWSRRLIQENNLSINHPDIPANDTTVNVIIAPPIHKLDLL